MRRLIRVHRPWPGTLRAGPPFELLVRAVAHQQLHGRAAESILARLVALFPGRRFPRPEDLLAVPPRRLRGAGFSRAKVLALRDIAARTLDGVVPPTRAIARLDDEAIVARLTTVRGVGRWTVQMLLLFRLGRPDVLPVDDFGIRAGFRAAYGGRALPTPRALLAHGERWRPYRSTAAWYLWRAAEAARGGGDEPVRAGAARARAARAGGG
jgi:DNA-3-methyladenine glycosylase II